MAQCKNRIGERCKLDGEICKHLVYDGKCKFADIDDVNPVTFQDGIDGIFSLEIDERKKKDHKRNFQHVLTHGGFSWNSPIESFTYEVCEGIVKELDLKYAPATVSDIIGSIYSASNTRLRSYYKSIKKRTPVFEKYKYVKKGKKKLSLEWEQVTAINYEMERLRRLALDTSVVERKRNTARNLFIMFWWGYWFGTRPGDINHMKWENITYISGVPHVKYTPNKTKNSTGIEITWEMPNNAFNQIHKFIRTDDEYCLTCDEKFLSTKTTRKRTRVHQYYWKVINKFFRSIGVVGWAGFYALRYRTAQNTYKKYGEEAEERKLGHSRITGRKAYYNQHDHSIAV